MLHPHFSKTIDHAMRPMPFDESQSNELLGQSRHRRPPSGRRQRMSRDLDLRLWTKLPNFDRQQKYRIHFNNVPAALRIA